jgi:hypothetical protein
MSESGWPMKNKFILKDHFISRGKMYTERTTAYECTIELEGGMTI